MLTRFELAREHFQAEHDRTEKFRQQTAFLYGMTVSYLAGLFILLNGFSTPVSMAEAWILSSGITAFLVFCALIFAIYSDIWFPIRHLDRAVDIEKYRHELVAQSPEKADEWFTNFLIRRYEDIAATNADRNKRRGNAIYVSKLLLTVASVPFTFTFVTYMLEKWSNG